MTFSFNENSPKVLSDAYNGKGKIKLSHHVFIYFHLISRTTTSFICEFFSLFQESVASI